MSRRPAGPVTVARTAASRGHPARGQAQVATARCCGQVWLGAALTAASILVGRLVAVVAQPEEPHQPDDEQAHVQQAEANHEDPPLRAHASMIDRRGRAENPRLRLAWTRSGAGGQAPGRVPAALRLGRLSGMYVTV